MSRACRVRAAAALRVSRDKVAANQMVSAILLRGQDDRSKFTGMESAPADRAVPGAFPVRKDQRSAVTNGRRLHAVAPGDTRWARRFRDVLCLIISDLGGHGAGLSEGQRQLARRAATISIECEKMEGEAAAGAPFDVVTYGMLTDRLGRVLERLGLRRQPRFAGNVIDNAGDVSFSPLQSRLRDAFADDLIAVSEARQVEPDGAA